MNPVGIGTALAVVLAGPQLYAMVQGGQLDLYDAMLRLVIVAVACAVGAGYLARLAERYAAQQRRQRTIDTLTRALEATQPSQAPADPEPTPGP